MAALMCTLLEVSQEIQDADLLLARPNVVALMDDAVAVHLNVSSMQQCTVLQGSALPYARRCPL